MAENNFLILKMSLGYTGTTACLSAKLKFHLGNSPEVDDVFQRFFLRLLEKPVPKKEVLNQRPYLYKMITYNIVDDVRITKIIKNIFQSIQLFRIISLFATSVISWFWRRKSILFSTQ